MDDIQLLPVADDEGRSYADSSRAPTSHGEDAKDKDYPDDSASQQSQVHITASSQQSDEQQQKAPPPAAPPAPPDGSLHAWLTVLGSLFAFFNTWGLVQAFGAYQSYYTTSLLRDYDASTIAWIGTIQAFLLVFIGAVAGPIYDQGHFRLLVLVGSFMIVFGVMMLSLATKYWQILLSQSVCVGLGSGLLFTPALAQITVLFTKKRPIALGLAMMGTGIGGIVYPIIFDQLEPRIGFAWATRVIGFIALGTLAISGIMLTWQRTIKRPPRALFQMAALKEIPFVLYGLSAWLVFTAYWIPWFIIPLFGRFGVGATPTFSAYLLSITNATGIIGRLITPLVQKKFTALQTILGASVLCDILIWAWISVDKLPNFIAFCVFWGLVSGPIAVLPAAAVAELSPDMSVLGTRMGMIWAFSSFGTLVGSPVASAISAPTKNDFLGVQLYAGATMFASAALTTIILVLLHFEKKKKQVQI